LAAASDLEFVKGKNKNNSVKSIELGARVGELIAKKALERKITSVVFDRGGYKYHGLVKAVAEGARKAGLKF
jgi:large subunit ribosomal protein L18